MSQTDEQFLKKVCVEDIRTNEPKNQPSTTKCIDGYYVPVTCNDEKLKLALLNAHERDKHICFSDIGHIYFVRGQSDGWISTTTFIKTFFDKFDGFTIASNMVNRKDFKTTKRYKQYAHVFHMEKKDQIKAIMEQWEINRQSASEAGTTLHRNIELYYNDIYIKDDSKEFQYFLNYDSKMKTDGWVPYRTEWLMYHDVYKITGSIDMVYYHPEKKLFIIRDWKRSKKINRWSYCKKTGEDPITHIVDCNFSHYSLQQNMYKFFLEQNYNIKVHDMSIVIFHENNDNFVEYEIRDLQLDIMALLETRVQDVYINKEKTEINT